MLCATERILFLSNHLLKHTLFISPIRLIHNYNNNNSFDNHNYTNNNDFYSDSSQRQRQQRRKKGEPRLEQQKHEPQHHPPRQLQHMKCPDDIMKNGFVVGGPICEGKAKLLPMESDPMGEGKEKLLPVESDPMDFFMRFQFMKWREYFGILLEQDGRFRHEVSRFIRDIPATNLSTWVNISAEDSEDSETLLEHPSPDKLARILSRLRAMSYKWDSDKSTLLNEYKKNLSSSQPAPEVRKVIIEEIKILFATPTFSPEFGKIRSYLDWVTSLPWGVYSKDRLDIKYATEVLNAHHYGLHDVKQRILEFIAVGRLKGDVDGKIILLVGPPGVGKTSIAKSIAEALERKFFKISVGSLDDVSEIKGHQRTFVQSLPGKLIHCMKMVKVCNPVILLDEIDKIGRSHNGDPSSALLEVLDPVQNKKFVDHYIELPFDLSKVLFICTANVTHTISQPLLDRMEVIRLNGYISNEKIAIAKKHLIPLCRAEAGLGPEQALLNDSVLQYLVHSFSKDAGVRNLKKLIDKIFRKIAFKVVQKPVPQVSVTKSNLRLFIGKAIRRDRYYDKTPVGVAMALAATEFGGTNIYIETVVDRFQKKVQFQTTGHLGGVMKESTNIAYTFAKTHLANIAPGNMFFESNALHMHVPGGGIPKDGPSAGCSMVTSLFSLALGEAVRSNLAMSGEVTLTGKVLPIGSVLDKAIAARSFGVDELVLPSGNKRDWEEVPIDVKMGITVHFVEQYDDMIGIAFPGLKSNKNAQCQK